MHLVDCYWQINLHHQQDMSPIYFSGETERIYYQNKFMSQLASLLYSLHKHENTINLNLAYDQDFKVFYNSAYSIQQLHAAGYAFLIENRMKIKLFSWVSALCVKQNRCGSIILRVKNQPILSFKHSGTPAKSPLSPMILLRKTIQKYFHDDTLS